MTSPIVAMRHEPSEANREVPTVLEFSNWERLSVHSHDWDMLARQSKLGPAHEMDWLRVLSEERCAGRQLVVKILRESGKVQGGAAFVCEKEWRKGVIARVIKPLNFFHQLRGTQLILPCLQTNAGLTSILNSLHGHRSAWDLLFMYYQKDEPQETCFLDYLRTQGHPYSVTQAGRAPFLKLSGTWEEGMGRLHRKFRTELRSREKRLRERGRVELRFLDQQENWKAGLDAIEEIERQSWKPAEGFPITHPHHWRFYLAYAQLAASKATLRVPILYVDDQPVAFDYGIYQDGTYFLLQTSYAQRWNEFYPGSVLRKLVIEWLYGIHAEEIDFGAGDDIWKRKWTDAAREYRLYTVFNRSLRGYYLALLNRFAQAVRET